MTEQEKTAMMDEIKKLKAENERLQNKKNKKNNGSKSLKSTPKPDHKTEKPPEPKKPPRESIRINLPREILELWRFASTDNNRSNLQYIRIERTPSDAGLRAIVTDGHRLALVDECYPTNNTDDTLNDLWFYWEGRKQRSNYNSYGNSDKECFYLSAETCKQILKGARKDSEFLLDINLNTSAITLRHVNKSTQITQEPFCGQYPDYTQVMPKKSAPVETIAFDVAYLADVATYLKKVDAANTGLKLTFQGDDLSPALGKANLLNGRFEYVLMPMRA